MRNLWIVEQNPLAAWVADLSALSDNPRALLDWMRAVITAGEYNEIYIVHQAPQIGYDRARNGALTDYLERQYTENGIVDVFDFARSGSLPIEGVCFRSSARLAYYDNAGQRIEADVNDPGALLGFHGPPRVRSIFS